VKLQAATTGGLYVWPDTTVGAMVPGRALAGPFETPREARAWMVARDIADLDADQRAMFETARRLAGGADADPEVLVTVVAMIRARKPRAYIELLAFQSSMPTAPRTREPGED